MYPKEIKAKIANIKPNLFELYSLNARFIKARTRIPKVKYARNSIVSNLG